jgi:glycosyltransferase involved in cell wall biosynthesis
VNAYIGKMTAQQNPSASLIIPTYKREEALVTCLQCALAQTYQPLEILVVDQTESHAEPTARFLNDAGEKIRVVHHSPPSAVTARNRALQEAKGEILIFIDDDTTFESAFVEAHVAAHQSDAEVVQGRVMEPGRSPSYRAQWVLPWLRVVGSNTYDRTSKTNTVTGCNFSISRKVVERVGEFDTNFTGTLINEDADYGARCYKAGLKMIFDADACLMHHRDSSGGVDANMKAALRIFEISVLRNELYFARKHFPAPVVWIYKWRMARRLKRVKRKTGKTPPIPARQLLRQADRAAKDLLRTAEAR